MHFSLREGLQNSLTAVKMELGAPGHSFQAEIAIKMLDDSVALTGGFFKTFAV